MLFLSALLICFTIACQNGSKNASAIDKKVETSPENEALQWVERAIGRAGGFDTWKSKKTLAYTKTIQFYDSLGNLSRTVVQEHKYQLQPTFKANIKWEEDGDLHEIVNTGKRAVKWVNGIIQQDQKSRDGAWNSSFGSHYVISMPFKLKDPGALLRYKGVGSVVEKQVHDIPTTYEKDAGSSGGMHTWHYYIDTETFELVANYLDYGDGHSFTSYHDYTNIQGIVMPTQRKSYSSNQNREPLILKTIYTNSDIRFDESLPKDIFDIRKP